MYFASNYGTTRPEEDKAKIFGSMFENSSDSVYLIQENKHLLKKAKYLANALRKTFSSLNTEDTWY